MKKRTVGLGLSAFVLFGFAACQASEQSKLQTTNTRAETPFPDPLLFAQSKCSGLSAQASEASAKATSGSNPDFSFGAAFALPFEVVEHFAMPVTTQRLEAQQWFDTAMAHMANFNHDEAIAAFREAQKIDPSCAMCYWGEGLAFGSNINAPYEAPRGAAGFVATQKAVARIESLSAKEAALIGALAVRYEKTPTGGVIENAGAYADAMDQLVREWPDDKILLSLAAEANMDTQPWDYWNYGAGTPKGRTVRTLELLERAINIDPDYAPAIHLYIHVTESSVDPYRAEPYADRLQAQAFGVGHLVHMPSHIYLRLGRWQKSHDANIAAIAADEAYIAASENAAFYGAVYYPHNVHFVVSSSHYAGDAKTALEMAGKLATLVDIDPSAPNPLAEHIAASTIYTALLYGEGASVLDIPAPPQAHLYMRVAWHYARGAKLAELNQLDRADAELASLASLSEEPGFDDYQDVFQAPLPGILKVAMHTLEGRIAAAEGDLPLAIDRLEAAANAEAGLPYFEPTWWFYPTRQTLAGYLLQDGQYERAQREFYRTLIKAPNNAYALFGLAEAYKATGNATAEAYARELFDKAWLGTKSEIPDLSKL